MLYSLWVFLHIVGAFGFVAAHGAGIAIFFALRRERQPDRLLAMLDLSASTRPATYVSLLLLLVGGIAAGFLGTWWSFGWINTAVVLLIVQLALGMTLIPHFRRLRVALKAAAAGAPDSQAALDAVLRAQFPTVIASLETLLIVVTIWLMVYKPF